MVRVRISILNADRFQGVRSEAVEAYQGVLGSHHPYTLTAKNNLAMLYSEQGRFDKAEPMFLEILDIRLETLGETHSDTLVSKGMLASAYRRAGRMEQAEAMGQDAYNGLSETLGHDHPYTKVMIGTMINIYRDWEKPKEMEHWQARGRD